jgi:hypothetical protein
MVPPVPPPELKACNSNQAEVREPPFVFIKSLALNLEVGEPPFVFYKKPDFKF